MGVGSGEKIGGCDEWAREAQYATTAANIAVASYNQRRQIQKIANGKRIPMAKNNRGSTFTTGVALGGFFGGFMIGAFLLAGFLSAQERTLSNLNFDPGTTIIIVLTALSIMLTTLAIIIAVVGAFGFSVLRTESFNAGAEHVSEQLGEDGELRSIIETRVDVLVARLQSGRMSTNDFPNPESEHGE